jgi:hypothetical protein
MRSRDVALYQLAGADARDDGAGGTLIAGGRTGEVIEGPGGSGVRVWAGAAADPFYLDLRQLAGIIEGLRNNKPIEFGEWTVSQASSSLTGLHACAIVLEVPGTDARLRPGRDIGLWGAAKLATDAGGWRQVNRAAIPMMWPLFFAIGDADDSSDYARDTASHPADGSRQRPGAYLRHDRRLGTDHRNRKPAGVWQGRDAAAAARPAALQGGNGGRVQLRRIQRADTGRTTLPR